MIVTVIILRI